jgi:TRAP-type C4-dicarboxylate transport system permease small subunit
VLEVFRRNLKHFKWILVLIIASWILFYGVNWWEGRGSRGSGGGGATTGFAGGAFGRSGAMRTFYAGLAAGA